MGFVWIEGRPVWNGIPNPAFAGIDGVVVSRKTGEHFLLKDGSVVSRLPSATDNGSLTANGLRTCECSTRSILKPAFRRSRPTGNDSRPTRQRPLGLPTMNSKGELEYDIEEIDDSQILPDFQQAETEREYDDDEVEDLQAAGQRPLILPEMNFEDSTTTNPDVEYDEEEGDDRLINTREPLGQKQEALLLPGSDDFDCE